MNYQMAACLTFAFFILTGCASHTNVSETITANKTAHPLYNAEVDHQFHGKDGTLLKGIKMYHTVQSAIESVPYGEVRPYVIYLKNGIYHEKLHVNRSYVSLIGQSENKTILEYGVAAGDKRTNHTTYGTDGSASVTVTGNHFTAQIVS